MRALLGSLSFRLALIYVGLFGGSLLLVLGTFYLLAIHFPMEEARARIAGEARLLQNVYIVDGADALKTALQRRENRADSRRPFHAFVARDGRVVSANLPSWPQQPSQGWWRLEADHYRDGDEIDYEALSIDHRFVDGARLILGRDIEDISEVEEVVRSGALAVLGVAMAVGLVGGAVMSIAIGRRIDAVSSTARRVMAGDLTQRVPLRGSGDDFDRLAETLNLMLARIEAAVEAVRRVSDSVVHELRTPLARLRADLEDASAGAGADRQARLAAAIEEADRLERIFEAVLRIARIEAGRHEAGMRPVDLSTLLEDVVDYYRPAAEERGMIFLASIDPDVAVVGDPDLLFQAMANLIDNAIKYGPEQGVISVSARAQSTAAVVLIADDGPGISPVHSAQVIERFYRAPTSAGTPGNGLGLSLVDAVARLHRATLAFEDAAPGLRVRWTMPRA